MGGKVVHAQPGYRYGLLIVIRDADYDPNHRRVLVSCNCGAIRDVLVTNLTRGNTKSCGATACQREVRRAEEEAENIGNVLDRMAEEMVVRAKRDLWHDRRAS